MRPAVVVLGVIALTTAVAAADAPPVARRYGSMVIRADPREARAGGLMIVRLEARRAVGAATAILGGHKVPFFASGRSVRALVPLGVDAEPGPAVLGIEMYQRSRVRIPVNVSIGSRAAFGTQTVEIPEDRRALLTSASTVRDSRLLLQSLRTLTPRQMWSGPFRPPVSVEPADTFGAAMTYIGAAGGAGAEERSDVAPAARAPDSLRRATHDVERMTDSVFGEFHRGLDYWVAEGTSARSPAGGTVVLAQSLTVTGNTVVIDHGQSVVSVFYHLARIDVARDAPVAAGTIVGTAGATGIASRPHLHWGVYVDGVAVDPRIFLRGID